MAEGRIRRSEIKVINTQLALFTRTRQPRSLPNQQFAGIREQIIIACNAGHDLLAIAVCTARECRYWEIRIHDEVYAVIDRATRRPGATYGEPPQTAGTVVVRVSVTVPVPAGGDSVKGILLTATMLLGYIV